MRCPAKPAELSRRLAREAEAVCRAYLANGRRKGGYWTVGDIHNTPGRSLYVRLKGGESGPGAAGKWTDAATGEHGDLLDLIARARNLDRLGDVLDEARTFLSLPRPEWISPSPDAARAIGVARGRPPPVSRRTLPHRHARRILSPRPGNHRVSPLAEPALSPIGLLPRL